MKKDRYRKLKVKLLLLIAFVFVVLVSVVNFLENKKTKRELEQKIELKSAFVKQVYDNILSNYKSTLNQKATEIINNEKVIERFANRDRQALRELTLPVFEKMSKSMDGFSIMHFHLPGGESFLRLHALESYGDDLSDIRAMIQAVHAKKQPTFGFEMGKFDDSFLTYRVARPVFDKQGNYLGAFEMGINSQAIVNTIKDIFSRIDAQSAFFVQKDKLRYSLTLPHVQHKKTQFLLASETPAFKDEEAKVIFDSTKQRLQTVEGIFQFRVYEDFVKNFTGDSIGVFALQYDITTDMANYKRYILQLLVFSIGVMMIVLVVVNYGFNYYLHRIESEHRLFVAEHEKAQLILDSQNNLVVLVDNGVPLLANKSFLRFFHVKSIKEFKEKYGSLVSLFLNKEGYFCFDENSDPRHWVRKLKDLPLHQRKVAIEKENKEVIFDIEISEYEGQDSLYVLTFDDITQLMSKHEELSKRVYLDSLTSIYNRRYFEKISDDIFAKVKKGLSYGAMLFDIDKFKDVNDTYGHNFGDEVLKVIASTVARSLRNEDIFVRWGGEEFVVILPSSSEKASMTVAQKLRRQIKEQAIGQIHVTCSFGVTTIREDDTKQSVIERVDKAMYAAKKEGRDRVVYL
ncbi:MAG: diguanylate cyclase [Campylobacterota bacterium]